MNCYSIENRDELNKDAKLMLDVMIASQVMQPKADTFEVASYIAQLPRRGDEAIVVLSAAIVRLAELEKAATAAPHPRPERQPNPCKPERAVFFSNGSVIVFEANGAQISDLQFNLISKWAVHAYELGFDVVGLVVETAVGKYRVVRDASDGGFGLSSNADLD